MGVWSALDAPVGEVEPNELVLSEAVESELAVDVHELSAEQLGARSLRLRASVDGLLVALARTDAAFESTRAFRELDPSCAKASQWLTKQTGLPVKQARAAYRQARRLMLLPALQMAVIAGVATWWHATAIVRLASSPARVRQLRVDAGALTEAAGALSTRDFERYEHGGPTAQDNGRLRCVDHHEGRRADPDTRARPWEYAEDDWDTLRDARVEVLDSQRRPA